jgi:hypothetical protein
MRRITLKILTIALFGAAFAGISQKSVRASDSCGILYGVCVDDGSCCGTPWDPSHCDYICQTDSGGDSCSCRPRPLN